jgi:hypothetical protein
MIIPSGEDVHPLTLEVRMPDPFPNRSSAWLFALLLIGGCAGDPVSSLDRGTPASATDIRSATTVASGPGSALSSAHPPEVRVGTVWAYDVTIRTRTRPQDGSEPWSDWAERRVKREARAIEERVLDGRTYVVIQEFDEQVIPPGPTRVGFKVPHRQDNRGLYHRPPPIVIGLIAGNGEEGEPSRRGGPVGEDALLIPKPARPGDEFVSNRQFGERKIVERHEPVRTGIGTVAAVRTRLIAGERFRMGDEVLAWYVPSGRVASHENRVRVSFGPLRRPLWTEVDTNEKLIGITMP